jgi:hypothetical protein
MKKTALRDIVNRETRTALRDIVNRETRDRPAGYC